MILNSVLVSILEFMSKTISATAVIESPVTVVEEGKMLYLTKPSPLPILSLIFKNPDSGS